MDYRSFEGVRWKIVYGEYEGVEKYAVNELYKVVQQNVPYILTLNHHGDTENLKDFNLIFIGTIKSNSHIKEFASKEVITLNPNKEDMQLRCAKVSITAKEKWSFWQEPIPTESFMR